MDVSCCFSLLGLSPKVSILVEAHENIKYKTNKNRKNSGLFKKKERKKERKNSGLKSCIE
jgi:hypothetical protein